MLNTCVTYSVSGVLICSTIVFSSFGDIPSTPGDLFSFILLILLATTSGVTTNCPNISPSGPLNFVSCTGNELVSSLVNTELKCTFNSTAMKNPCVRPYYISSIVLQWSNLISNILLTSYTHRNSYCLILYYVQICAQHFA